MSDRHLDLTLMRLEASPLYLAPVHLIFQKIHEIAITKTGELPAQLIDDVKSLSPLEKRELAEKTKKACTLLFSACKSGNVNVAQSLLENLEFNIERKCTFEEDGEPIVHQVPPLWCAAVSNHFLVVDLLLQHGADINRPSSNGSTPLLSVCSLDRAEMVQWLVWRGADINRVNHDGATCLMGAVRNRTTCEYLLKEGAELNKRDVEGRNALYFAIETLSRLTANFLIHAGIDMLVRDGPTRRETAVIMASLKGEQRIVNDMIHLYSLEDQANALELLGACQTVRPDFRELVFDNWAKAVALREANNMPKEVIVQRECYGAAREFVTISDIERLRHSELEDHLLQSAIIAERVLGIGHEDTRFLIMRAGAKYADSLKYQRYFNLWSFCLKLRIEEQSLFNFQTAFTAEGLVRVLLDLYRNQEQVLAGNNYLHEDMRVTFDNAYQVFLVLSGELEESRKLLRIRPEFKKQMQNYDRIYKCVTHLVYLMLKTASNDTETTILKDSVTQLIKRNITSAGTNDTLLHLSVSRLNYIKHDILIFPSYEVVALLLECEARVNAQNGSKSTPLHVATTPYNFNNEIIQLLLDNGAHLDLPNKLNDHPAQYISMNPATNVPLANYTTLMCCAATTIVRYRIPYKGGQLPATLEKFVSIHEA